jgi:bifunctional non-homologous end joining protein LigD
MAGLREYHRKRHFGRTPEPRGGATPRGDAHRFVVQKHAASRLHYDFRLELDGTLKSWAVPKGPSLDPADKRLAMQTEDHPVDYADFEGVIPEGEYGGGSVVVWDHGTWQPVDDPRAGMKKGRLAFTLDGEKLHGRWSLVQIRGRAARDAGKSWLLIKGRDDFARSPDDPPLTETRPESVTTGRGVEDVARDQDRVWRSNRPAARKAKPARPATRPRPAAAAIPKARRAPAPDRLQPALATLVATPPAGGEWLHEMKFDGYRILAHASKSRVRLLSRNANDWTDRFPTVARAVGALGIDGTILDGEVALLRPDGTTSFNGLQNAASPSDGTLVYFVFDLPWYAGFDLTASPLEARKAALRAMLGPSRDGALRYSDHVEGQGDRFFSEACRMALEGVVSKRRDAPYAGGRTRAWLKVKCVQGQEVVIGGFTEPKGRRSGLGALLIGVNEDGALRYAGKVGTGFTTAQARELRARLDAIERKESPFAGRPPRAAQAHWVQPSLVAEVDFTEWTPEGRLRHPSFKGLREDKPAREIARERPRARAATATGDGATDAVAGVRLTHPERVLYPETGLTKRGLAEFYVGIADWILPHLVGRPTTLVRCPEGLAGECFYQKHTGYWAPASLRRIQIKEKQKTGQYLVVDDLAGLVGLVQIGILEVHTWNATSDGLERPDRLVFDLDPGDGVPWDAVVAAARLVRERLRDHGLESFVKTTGGKGLHVVAPIDRGPSWETCGRFAREVAEALAREAPDAFVATMTKARRHGRIFVDWLRNVRGATAVAAYSTRAKPNAPVSTPLAWDELGPRTTPERFTVATLPRRLGALRADPWADYRTTRQALRTSRRAAG